MIRYFVLEYNSKLNRTRLISFKYSADLAYEFADKLNNISRNHLSYYVYLCDSSSIQSKIDRHLIDCCCNVANCLYFAERAILKKSSRHGNAEFWFNKAFENCESAVKYLE